MTKENKVILYDIDENKDSKSGEIHKRAFQITGEKVILYYTN